MCMCCIACHLVSWVILKRFARARTALISCMCPPFSIVVQTHRWDLRAARKPEAQAVSVQATRRNEKRKINKTDTFWQKQTSDKWCTIMPDRRTNTARGLKDSELFVRRWNINSLIIMSAWLQKNHCFHQHWYGHLGQPSNYHIKQNKHCFINIHLHMKHTFHLAVAVKKR